MSVKWPEHKAGMCLTHNEHKDCYETIRDFLVNAGINPDDQAARSCIDADEIWCLTWYPDTPVCFCRVIAPSFRECLQKAMEPVEKESGVFR